MRVYTMYSRGRAEGSCGSSSPFHESSSVFFFLPKRIAKLLTGRGCTTYSLSCWLVINCKISFVNGASYREFEVGVMAELHIGKVLM